MAGAGGSGHAVPGEGESPGEPAAPSGDREDGASTTSGSARGASLEDGPPRPSHGDAAPRTRGAALPDALRLPTPRQPTPEVRAAPAYRAYAGVFITCLTLAIALFVLPFFLPTRWHWPLWIASGAVILATAPFRSWAIRRGLLSYYIHGVAVVGTVVSMERDGEETWVLRYRYPAPDGSPVDAETVVYDSPVPPASVGASVPVLHREDDPRDSVLPVLAGLLGG